mmetsp:Transcript_41907/g.108540  ORF Transcript_41907/g.108540 Transcript_41907/m.108540 type:complete len:269 (+) Transcript_41907:90-896(+)
MHLRSPCRGAPMGPIATPASSHSPTHCVNVAVHGSVAPGAHCNARCRRPPLGIQMPAPRSPTRLRPAPLKGASSWPISRQLAARAQCCRKIIESRHAGRHLRGAHLEQDLPAAWPSQRNDKPGCRLLTSKRACNGCCSTGRRARTQWREARATAEVAGYGCIWCVEPGCDETVLGQCHAHWGLSDSSTTENLRPQLRQPDLRRPCCAQVHPMHGRWAATGHGHRVRAQVHSSREAAAVKRAATQLEIGSTHQPRGTCIPHADSAICSH